MTLSITGRVTQNGMGRPGVCISNGETVTRTARGGGYRLRVDPAQAKLAAAARR